MIYHGTRYGLFGLGSRTIIRGYYIVLPNGDRRYLSLNPFWPVIQGPLNKMKNKYCQKEMQHLCWVDWCDGQDENGDLIWFGRVETEKLLKPREYDCGYPL